MHTRGTSRAAAPHLTPQQRDTITKLTQAVLDTRAAHPEATLADLYHPDTYPLYTNLKAAHDALDATVLATYGLPATASHADILEALFARYTELLEQERDALETVTAESEETHSQQGETSYEDDQVGAAAA